jgi:hypothetical protein
MRDFARTAFMAACAAARHQDLRSLAPAALTRSFCSPRHDGDLGASFAAGERPQRPGLGARAHRPLGMTFTAVQAYESPTRHSNIRATSTAPPSSWRPASRRPCDYRHDRRSSASLGAAGQQADPASRLEFEWYWHSSTWCGCSCSPASMCVGPAACRSNRCLRGRGAA